MKKNLFESIEEIEEDFKVANEQSGDEYTREEYYEETLENADVTKKDKALLVKWIQAEGQRNFMINFVNDEFLTEERKQVLNKYGYKIKNENYFFETKSHAEFINSLELLNEDEDLRELNWVANTFRTGI